MIWVSIDQNKSQQTFNSTLTKIQPLQLFNEKNFDFERAKENATFSLAKWIKVRNEFPWQCKVN